jgi:hypothetical protein
MPGPGVSDDLKGGPSRGTEGPSSPGALARGATVKRRDPRGRTSDQDDCQNHEDLPCLWESAPNCELVPSSSQLWSQASLWTKLVCSAECYELFEDARAC